MRIKHSVTRFCTTLIVPAVALAVGYRRTDQELVSLQDKGKTKLLETWVHDAGDPGMETT